MWVRKSDEQVAKERRASWRSFRPAFAWFVLMFLGGIVKAIQGPNQHAEHWPITWSEILLCSTLFATVFAVVMYVLQLTLRSSDPFGFCGGKVVMCDRCYRTKNVDGKHTCECGGKFDDFDNWKWVDDDGWNPP